MIQRDCLLALAAIAAVSSCRAPEALPDTPEAGPWCYLGTTGDLDGVQQLLRRNGILAVFEGSVVYSVLVRRAYAERALVLVDHMESDCWDPTDEVPPQPLRSLR
jgi:hypothetical protein